MVSKRILHSSIIVLSFCLLTSLVVYKGNPVVVSGNSMSPTFIDGDIILFRAKRVTSKNLDGYPVCVVKLNDGTVVLKRLVGYPGDTVHVTQKETVVNGEVIMMTESKYYNDYTFNLGYGDFLFLGDNRDGSVDARHWSNPYVKLEDILFVVSGTELVEGGY